MDRHSAPELAPNWTTAAGALEGVLEWLGAPLPRHAVMGLTGHAWHTCLASRGGVHALPSGCVDLDWEAMVERYSRTGVKWDRFGGRINGDPALRDRAIAWVRERLDEGRPIVGFDFHLHEFAIVFGYDDTRDGFLVNSMLTPDGGPFVPAADWPSSVGMVELFAPGEPVDDEPGNVVVASLETALETFAGADGPDDGQARGTAAIERWAEVLDGPDEVDRQGNAYMLVVTQAARLDGADYLRDLADALEPAAEPLRRAERALRDEAQALAPLITLFPFPSGGHGNIASPGLREAAAMALRRAAAHERAAAKAIDEALTLLRPGD